MSNPLNLTDLTHLRDHDLGWRRQASAADLVTRGLWIHLEHGAALLGLHRTPD